MKKDKQIRFPFFNVSNPNLKFTCQYLINTSLEEIAEDIRLKKLPPEIIMQYTHWCNNIGEGIYFSSWRDYHWLQGIYLNSTPCNQISLRYDYKTISERNVYNHGAIILKRHAKRYLNSL